MQTSWGNQRENNDKTLIKGKEATKLARLFEKGYLKETETGYQVLERRGKKFTRVEMTFRVDIKGVDLPDEYKNG